MLDQLLYECLTAGEETTLISTSSVSGRQPQISHFPPSATGGKLGNRGSLHRSAQHCTTLPAGPGHFFKVAKVKVVDKGRCQLHLCCFDVSSLFKGRFLVRKKGT